MYYPDVQLEVLRTTTINVRITDVAIIIETYTLPVQVWSVTTLEY
jgi:hypothetical protein